jgi:hypothetical protein
MVGVDVEISGNTDIDTYTTHQQISFNINYTNYRVNNPIEEFKPVVCQNRRWDNCINNLRPTYIRNNQLIYSHNKQLIFDAGNEYRRFEIIDDKVPTMRIEKIEYHAPFYHVKIFTDEQRIVIKEAIEDHRASSKNVPRSDYGKIISSADRSTNVDDFLSRTHSYTLKHQPDSTITEMLERAYQHTLDKYGDNGYAKHYVIDDEYIAFRNEISSLLDNKNEFEDRYKKVNNIE